MLKHSLIILFFFIPKFGIAQNHVKWNANYNQDTKEVVLTGKIEEGWHLYSTSTPKNSGPIPVEVMLNKNKNYKQIGSVKELSTAKLIFDVNFGSDVVIIENEYLAAVKIKVKRDCNVTGEVYYMICNDQMCLPPINIPFTIDVK